MRNFIQNRAIRYADVPANLESDRCRKKIESLLKDPILYEVKDEYNHKDVRECLKRHFGSKCVYCESSPIASSSFRIDHFRPKKGIKEVSDIGYYWLAYEWTNLMQSCQLCNGVKLNFFPLNDEKTRVKRDTADPLLVINPIADQTPLNNEERLLLHPELDEVEDHFSFEPDGKIMSNTTKGQTSIKYYNLQRGDLVLCRKTINDKLLTKIKEALVDYEKDLISNTLNPQLPLFRTLKYEFGNLLWSFRENQPYSLYCFYVFDKFEQFVVDFIPVQEHKDLLLEAYNKYKNNQLN